MEMLKTIQDAHRKIEELGEYLGEIEKRARWRQKLQCSPVAFALELIAVCSVADATMDSLVVLKNDVAAMLETLNRTEKVKIALELIKD